MRAARRLKLHRLELPNGSGEWLICFGVDFFGNRIRFDTAGLRSKFPSEVSMGAFPEPASWSGRLFETLTSLPFPV